jgi:hypothetical protein
LVVGAFVVFFKIIKNKNENTSLTLATLHQKIKEKEDSIIFAERIAEIQTLQNEVASSLINPNNIDKFAGYLEEVGASMGTEVFINNIEVPPKIKNTMIFKISIDGEFQEVMKTIALLENIPYQINLTQVYLNKEIIQLTSEEIKSNKVPNTQTWQANVVFNILSSN